MTVCRVTRCRKVYLLGNVRVHHGLAGALAAVLGAVLMLHDRRDFPWRLRDR